MILAIESGGEFVSVALGIPSSCSAVTINTPRNSEELLLAIDFLKERAAEPISKIGVCIGPGSYTGLRVGLALAQGMSVGLDLPLVGVSSFLADIYSRDQFGDGIAESTFRLRENERALSKFEIKAHGKEIVQLGVSEILEGEAEYFKGAAKGVLRAVGLIEKVSSSEPSGGEVHWIKSFGTEPMGLMYLKGVQAKTLVERGVV
jgi:tRNA threonylcarbamoyl adenosine modification protein YeaZ